MIDLTTITVHEEITYTFMPPSVAHLIGFPLNAQKISGWELHTAHSAQKKGIIPADLEIPRVPLHQDRPNGLYVRNKREWVLISHLDPEELRLRFEDILQDDDISAAYLEACGQDDLDQY